MMHVYMTSFYTMGQRRGIGWVAQSASSQNIRILPRAKQCYKRYVSTITTSYSMHFLFILVKEILTLFRTWSLVQRMWYFLLKDRLKAYFKSLILALLFTWHCDNQSKDNVTCILTNNPAWKIIKKKYSQMRDARCIWLQLGTDGFHLFSLQSSSHLVWPIILSLLNLNPKLAMHKGHIMLNTIVSSM